MCVWSAALESSFTEQQGRSQATPVTPQDSPCREGGRIPVSDSSVPTTVGPLHTVSLWGRGRRRGLQRSSPSAAGPQVHRPCSCPFRPSSGFPSDGLSAGDASGSGQVLRAAVTPPDGQTEVPCAHLPRPGQCPVCDGGDSAAPSSPAGCAGHTGGSQRECALTPWERARRVSVMPFFFPCYQPFP